MEDLAACAVARISLDRMTKSLMPFIGVVLACLMLLTYAP
jgi:C4-dicarboxylate transporter DctM subunit